MVQKLPRRVYIFCSLAINAQGRQNSISILYLCRKYAVFHVICRKLGNLPRLIRPSINDIIKNTEESDIRYRYSRKYRRKLYQISIFQYQIFKSHSSGSQSVNYIFLLNLNKWRNNLLFSLRNYHYNIWLWIIYFCIDRFRLYFVDL